MSSPARGSRTPRRTSRPTGSESPASTPLRQSRRRNPEDPGSDQVSQEEMSSPARGLRTPRRTPRTPDGSGTPQRTEARRTPRQTPRPTGSESPISTPLRPKRRRNPEDPDVVPESDQVSQPPTSSPTHGVLAGLDVSSPMAPMPSNVGLGFSEIDMSSPLNYGTPGSTSSLLRTPRSGIRGTPVRTRPDIRTERRVRQVNVASDPVDAIDAVPPTSESEGGVAVDGPQLVVWGTDVVVSRCKEKFKRFIMRYIDATAEIDERTEVMDVNQPLYLQKLEEIHTLEEPFLSVNCAHIEAFDAELYRQLVSYPQEVIPSLDMAANELFFEKYPAAVLDHQIQVRPFNALKTRNMRALNPEDIDQLITVAGMVIRTSGVIPEMREAFFRCVVCSAEASVEIERGRVIEPTLCSHCNTNHCFTLIHNRSQFTDKQMVKLQESPDDMPPGQTPHTVILYVHGGLVDAVQAGDRVTVTGIFRAVPLQANPRVRNVRSVYRTHIDVVHFRKADTRRLHEQEDGKDHHFPPERIEQIKLLSRREDIYERLARAIAPSIYENEDIKKGILLQLFGGTKKTFVTSGRNNFRADINILLCGDPGTSKSQLLRYVYNLVPRSQYTSGKGSSAVGLTAYVTKDPETRQLVLQTGALVLADNGICCIDEFDKMNDSTRSVLHEVMEQQTISIAKAGIICQLNARTSILAAANPSESQWNTNKTIIENIQLPHTLMSRFDLIFLMLDPQNEIYDQRLARHLVSLYYRTQEEEDDEHLNMGMLRDYIAYTREHVKPTIGEAAGQRLVKAYVEMRKAGSGHGQVSAYPRQLESLVRLAEAHAKVYLSDTVEVIHVEEAWRLHREALKQSATDPLSGKIDVNILTTGLSTAARQRRAEIAKALKALVTAKGPGKSSSGTMLNYQNTLQKLRETSQLMITREMFEDALKDLQDDGVVVVTGRTTIRVC